MTIEESLDHYKHRGVFTPPAWIVSWYWSDYTKWADKFEPPDEKQKQGLAPAKYERDETTGEFPWAVWLGVSPRLDVWCMCEEALYGEVVTDSYLDYKQKREKR